MVESENYSCSCECNNSMLHMQITFHTKMHCNVDSINISRNTLSWYGLMDFSVTRGSLMIISKFPGIVIISKFITRDRDHIEVCYSGS